MRKKWSTTGKACFAGTLKKKNRNQRFLSGISKYCMNLSIQLVLPVLLLFSPACKIRATEGEKDKESIEKELVRLYDQFRAKSYGFDDVSDSLRITFMENLLQTLQNNAFVHYPFDSLGTRITLTTSTDKKLRVFSWDNISGGTWHDYVALYQYADQGKVVTGKLHTGMETGTGDYTDAWYHKIYTIDSTSPKYLVLGYGTHGGGHHFYIARLLEYKQGQLTDVEKAFGDKTYLSVIMPRHIKEEPIFNSEKKEIQFPEFVIDEETGFYQRSGKEMTLKYTAGKFVKK